MAYNNGFPIGYQPMYYPNQQMIQQQQIAPQQQAQQSQQSNGIIWVQGEAGAKSYLVAPNTTIQLWDSENQVIYLKSADASGMPSMKVLDYTIRDGEQNKNELNNQAEFVTKEDFEQMTKKIKELERKIKEVHELDELAF